MYIGFEKIERRNLEIYSDLINSHIFLIRSYMSDGVDEKHSDNTYADVIMVT